VPDRENPPDYFIDILEGIVKTQLRGNVTPYLNTFHFFGCYIMDAKFQIICRRILRISIQFLSYILFDPFQVNSLRQKFQIPCTIM
jgi:hypothetical protein